MDITPPKVGEQEMAVLQYVADHAPISAREVAEAVGQEKGIARTTVLTVLERLRQKEILTRRRRDGVFHYSPRVAQSDLLRNLVGQFIEKTLGGAVSPVVAYLAGNRQIPDDDLEELDRLVEELKAERKTGAAEARTEESPHSRQDTLDEDRTDANALHQNAVNHNAVNKNVLERNRPL